MQRSIHIVFLLLGLLFMLPALGIGWLMPQGNSIGMDPAFAMIILCMALAGAGTVVWMILRLTKGS